MTRETLEELVIQNVQQIQGKLRVSFQERILELASQPAAEPNEEAAWTGYVAGACERILKNRRLKAQERSLLRSLLQTSRTLLQLQAA